MFCVDTGATYITESLGDALVQVGEDDSNHPMEPASGWPPLWVEDPPGSGERAVAPNALAALCGFEWLGAIGFLHERHLRTRHLFMQPPCPDAVALGLDTALAARALADVVARRVPEMGDGFGLFARSQLSSGLLIGEYAGLVRTESGLASSQDYDGYCVSYCDTLAGETLVLSARHHGNIIRLINHATGSGANCALIRCVTAATAGVARLVVRATRDLVVGEQLLLDYGRAYWQTAPVAQLDLVPVPPPPPSDPTPPLSPPLDAPLAPSTIHRA